MSNTHTDHAGQVTQILDERRPLIAPKSLPAEVDVAIIGGGIVGCSAAWFLSQYGLRVALFEKGRVGCEQSGRNWGWVRQQGRAAEELPMMIRSRAIWQQWADEFDEDTGFKQGGCLYLARTESELQDHEAWLKIARQHELETTMLSSDELNRVLHNPDVRFAGALYTASDARAEPGLAVPVLARAAMKQGVIIKEHCAVRGIDVQAGRVAGVVTEHGVVKANKVLCAAGAWTSLFAGSLGITVPQLKLKGTVARTAAATEITPGTVWAPDIAIRRRLDGGYTVAHGSALEHAIVPASFRFARRYLPVIKHERGALRVRLNGEFLKELGYAKRWPLDTPGVFEQTRVLHPSPSKGILTEMRQAMAKSFPALKDAPFVETWAGMIESSPDLLPILGETDALPGLYLAAGFSGHGFGLGPGAGECLAQLMNDRAPAYPTHAFRLSRYFDGTKIKLGPSI